MTCVVWQENVDVAQRRFLADLIALREGSEARTLALAMHEQLTAKRPLGRLGSDLVAQAERAAAAALLHHCGHAATAMTYATYLAAPSAGGNSAMPPALKSVWLRAYQVV
jgi:hypothetical protein